MLLSTDSCRGGAPRLPKKVALSLSRGIRLLRSAAAHAAPCVLWLVVPQLYAERYLTVQQAQHLCFPMADQFAEAKLQPTTEELKVIEKQTGHKEHGEKTRCWLARRGTNLLGVLFVDRALGKHELIDYAVAVSPDGRVLMVEILEYREHYGAQITNAMWRAQFSGITTASKLKLSDDIYNISGATLSCRAVTDGVKRVLAIHDVVLRSRLAGPGAGALRLPDAIAPAR